MDLEVRIEIRRGDITEMEVDAIVNAANTDLLLGAGVAGAIRKRGGEQIQKECNQIAPIPLGEAAVTGAGNLKAKCLIHAAGMRLGGSVSEKSLRDTTRNSLLRADEMGLKTIAFPAIGTGVGGFPVDRCAEVMIDTVSEHMKSGKTSIQKVYFVLFDEPAFKIFDDCLKRIRSNVAS